MYFAKLLEDHRIPTYINIHEGRRIGRFEANGTILRFICKNGFLYLGATVKWTSVNIFHQ